MPQATVTINGREYDKHTGLPLDVARTGHQAMRQGAPSYTLPPLPADAAPAAPLPTAAPSTTGPTLLTPERPAAMPTPERPTSAPQAPAVPPTAAPSSAPLASKRYEPIPLPPVEPTITASDYKPFTAFTPKQPRHGYALQAAHRQYKPASHSLPLVRPPRCAGQAIYRVPVRQLQVCIIISSRVNAIGEKCQSSASTAPSSL